MIWLFFDILREFRVGVKGDWIFIGKLRNLILNRARDKVGKCNKSRTRVSGGGGDGEGEIKYMCS